MDDFVAHVKKLLEENDPTITVDEFIIPAAKEDDRTEPDISQDSSSDGASKLC
jgi:hypothetical protein